ncbi:MAG: hypothetical protein ACRDQW_13540 [Haloechinothrix sp.]
MRQIDRPVECGRVLGRHAQRGLSRSVHRPAGAGATGPDRGLLHHRSADGTDDTRRADRADGAIGTGDFPHLATPPSTLPDLLGGVYQIRHDPGAASWIDLPVVAP